MLVNQPVNQVNKVSFLECLSPTREGGTVEGLNPLYKIQNWLSLKAQIELSCHLRLSPSGALRSDLKQVQSTLDTWADCDATVSLPWNRPVSTLLSPQACCCFDCCNTLGWENKNGLKRECESTGERGRVRTTGLSLATARARRLSACCAHSQSAAWRTF